MNKYIIIFFIISIVCMSSLIEISTSSSNVNIPSLHISYENNTTIEGYGKGVHWIEHITNTGTFTQFISNSTNNIINSVSPYTTYVNDAFINFTTQNAPALFYSYHTFIEVIVNGTYDNTPINTVIPLSIISRANETEAYNGYELGDVSASITFSFTNNIYFNNNHTTIYSPYEEIFTPASVNFQTNTTSDNGNENFIVSDIFLNSIPSNEYVLTFTASQEFSLIINGATYPYTHKLTILVHEGIYNFSYYLGSSSTIKLSGSINVNNNTSVNLTTYFPYELPSISVYVYIAIVIIAMIGILRYTLSYIVIDSFIGIIFVYIGYIENLQYFTLHLFIYIITILSALFVYKVVMD